MTTPAPPGFLSPAASAFAPPLPVNDAPPPNVPYLIAYFQGNSVNGTQSFTPRVTTGRGDTIIVVFAGDGPPATASPPADSAGNAYGNTWLGYGLPAATGPSKSRWWTAVNTAPIGPSGTVSIVNPFGGSPLVLMVIGIPAAAGRPHMAIEPSAFVSTAYIRSGAAVSLTATSAASSAPGDVVISLITSQQASGTPPPINWAPQWAPVTGMLSFANGNAYGMTAAWLTLPAAKTAAKAVFTLPGTTTNELYVIAFTAETRLAPNRPPDMPPGIQSPGAWQYQPLIPPFPKVRTLAQSLPGVAAGTAAASARAGKPVPATAHPAGTLARSAGKPLAAAPRPAGTLTRQAVKTLAAVPHAAAARTAAAGKTLAAAPRTAGILARQARKKLAATPHAAAARTAAAAKTAAAAPRAAAGLARSAAKRLPAALRPEGTLTRAAAKTAAAQAAARAQLTARNAITAVVRLGTAFTRWAAGTASKYWRSP